MIGLPKGVVKVVPLLESIGYEYRGENGIPRRHFFGKGEPRTYHLHMVEQSSYHWRKATGCNLRGSITTDATCQYLLP